MSYGLTTCTGACVSRGENHTPFPPSPLLSRLFVLGERWEVGGGGGIKDEPTSVPNWLHYLSGNLVHWDHLPISGERD